MKFDLSKKEESNKAEEYFKKLMEQKSIVEIRKKFSSRTYNQNNYLHLLLSYTAMEYGETLEYFKQYIWKRLINKDIFHTEYINFKTSEKRQDWRSSADLSTKEMTIAIERLILFAAKEMNLELPEAHHFDRIRYIENQIEKNKRYL
jgi:hypothetical protein